VHANDARFIDQSYNHYQYIAARRSFLREIAAARTRARYVVLGGFLLFVGGGLIVLGPLLAWFDFIATARMEDEYDLSTTNNLSMMVIGALITVTGKITMIVGTILHVIATARRRRLL
jgi:hypothetical protein